MPTTTYSPVWISTDRQVDALASAYQSASIATKLIGRYELPTDVAFLQGILVPWMRVPLVFVAQGILSISETAISYEPKNYRVFGWRVRSHHKDFSFTLNLGDVLSVEPVEVKSPVMSAFNLPFTRIRFTKPDSLDNLLLCVGGRIAIPRIRARSQEMRQHLLTWHENAQRSVRKAT